MAQNCPGDAMFGMFSRFRLEITCVNGFGDEFRIHLQPKIDRMLKNDPITFVMKERYIM